MKRNRRRNWGMFGKAAGLVTASALLTLLLCLAALLAFFFWNARQSNNWYIPLTHLSDCLVQQQDNTYNFSESTYLEEHQLWAILIDQDGQVVWSYHKPDTVPSTYTLTQVASFSRWYLDDYPVQIHIRPDGLFVVGAPQGSAWKYNFITSESMLSALPYWVLALFLLFLCGVVGLAALVSRHWFRQSQQVRDTARAEWIHGISHDIRTPLSIVMGYASEWEHDATLPGLRREQAAVIRRQSQTIKALVNDLNLTMRLDYDMQPLRRAIVSPAALIRQSAADFLNRGMEDAFTLSVDVEPDAQIVTLLADAFLLNRALDNLINNCFQHNPGGCAITLGVHVTDAACILWVRNTGHPPDTAQFHSLSSLSGFEHDGGTAHGTGLKLVEQIAAAHSGTVQYQRESDAVGCQIGLPR